MVCLRGFKQQVAYQQIYTKNYASKIVHQEMCFKKMHTKDCTSVIVL